MIYPIYVIRDVHTGFMTPMVDQNDASALRNFEHAVMNTESLYHSHPKDYSLYKIGTYDTETAAINPIIPELIVDAFSLV